jgi:hypothetical protein
LYIDRNVENLGENPDCDIMTNPIPESDTDESNHERTSAEISIDDDIIWRVHHYVGSKISKVWSIIDGSMKVWLHISAMSILIGSLKEKVAGSGLRGTRPVRA